MATTDSAWTPQLGNIFQNFMAGSFRTNLRRLTGLSDAAVKGLQAHHVLPQALEDRFSQLGVNIHDPILERGWGQSIKTGLITIR
jgi:hypothetical protein